MKGICSNFRTGKATPSGSGQDRLLRPGLLGLQTPCPSLCFCGGPVALLVALAEQSAWVGGPATDLHGYRAATDWMATGGRSGRSRQGKKFRWISAKKVL
jgi:hypothetical protein